MPTKHIDDDSWAIIEEMAVEVTRRANKPVKEADILRLALKHGLRTLPPDLLDALATFNPTYRVLHLAQNFGLHEYLSPDADDYLHDFKVPGGVMACVWGQTCSGKSTFAESLKHMLEKTNFMADLYYHDEVRNTGELKAALSAFIQGRKVIITTHGNNPDIVKQRILEALIQVQN
ncbi:hypothetical protein P6Y92_004791 [Salmonella enterica]|nr:hypothetical protein [Salmonella enterica]